MCSSDLLAAAEAARAGRDAIATFCPIWRRPWMTFRDATYIGDMLARAGCRVSVVARSDYEAVARDGYRIDSAHGDLSFRPAQVLRSAAEWQGSADYLFVALKQVRGLDRAALIRPFLSPTSAVVLVQNGIDVEPEVAQAFPANPFISGVAYSAVSRLSPGVVKHQIGRAHV